MDAGNGVHSVAVAGLLPTTTDVSGPPIRPRSDTTWIYFLGINGERVRIGHSRQSRTKRQHQHARGARGLGFDVDVVELCEVRGKVSDESGVHGYFDHLRISGEQELFEPAIELIEYVHWLRDQWWVSVPQLTDQERDALPVVDATHWLPAPVRRKPLPDIEPPPPLFRNQPPIERALFDFGDRTITGDDFYTSDLIIAAVHALMGGIDLDPASHAIANRVVKATRFFSVADNGLHQSWSGRVWLNPPFSAWKCWVPKVIDEWRSGRISEMCVLSAMRTVTAQYFADLLAECDAVCIIRGRIKFWGGVAGDSPDDGHAIYYFGQDRQRFRDEFSQLGTVFYGAKS
jgi:hypothetical protein